MRTYCLPLLALAGCGNLMAVSLVPTNASPHDLILRAPGDVKVISTPPSEPFAEIGFIEGEPGTGYAVTPDAILYRMREAAGRWGCDYLLISSSTFSPHSQSVSGFGGIGYHGACIVLLDAAKSAALVKSPPTAVVDPMDSRSTYDFPSGRPGTTSPPATPTHKLLFRTAEGNVYRVEQESREQAVRAGWVLIGVE